MDPYSYEGLDIEREEIRLIQLRPGNLDDEISFTIFHASLNPPQNKLPSARLSPVELQETLPDGWRIKGNPDGQYLFCQPDKKPITTPWDHPDKEYDLARYEQARDDYLPGPGYKPEYEALSYTWASTLGSRNALVLNATDLRPVAEIQIGGNLASALQHLRYKDKSRVFWIDVLCINQNDKKERDFQVKRMGSIYSLAKRVVVWLGPEGDDGTHALSTLRYFGDQVELTVDNSISNSPGAKEPYWYSPFTSLPYDERTWECLSSLFNRVWVMQEVALANRDSVVHCGSYSLPWLTPGRQ